MGLLKFVKKIQAKVFFFLKQDCNLRKIGDLRICDSNNDNNKHFTKLCKFHQLELTFNNDTNTYRLFPISDYTLYIIRFLL